MFSSLYYKFGTTDYLSGVTSGRLPRSTVFCSAGFAVAMGVGGAEILGLGITASPPRASKSSACLVFFAPSFMPVSLKHGRGM